MKRLREIEPLYGVAGVVMLAGAVAWWALSLTPDWVPTVLVFGGLAWIAFAALGEVARRRDR